MNAADFLRDVHVLGIVCTQWGDTGKGKFVDYFAANWADIVARGTGGANAGHTLWHGGRKYVFHLLPSGMLHNKINVIGTGVAVDPAVVIEELAELEKSGVSIENLKLSLGARLILPQHIVLDRIREQSGGGIGTTGRGMGPVFADHVTRIGLVMNDLLNIDIFVQKLRRNLEEKIRLLNTYGFSQIQEIMKSPILMNGAFFDPRTMFNEDMIVDIYREYGKRLERFICNTDDLMCRAHAEQKKILLEGAQGNLLSVDYGTYPYVTPSDCSIAGLAKGVGLREQDVDLTLGILKGFYMTRVGEGPFPTELGGTQSALACRRNTKATEAASYPNASFNDPDEFIRGVAIRKSGDEYGATTGRPRRTGWLDLPLIRYSAQYLTGLNVILTKLDVLDGMKTVKVCTEYRYEGPPYRRGKIRFSTGDMIKVAVPDLEVMKYCQPVYKEFSGWHGPLRSLRNRQEIPDELVSLIRFIERETGVNVTVLSVGPDREETIVYKGPIFRVLNFL